MRNYFKSKTVRMFLLWYLCFFLVAGTVLTTVYIKEIRKGKEFYLISQKNDTESTMNYFNQILVATVNTCNNIFSTQWYEHYRNVANIFSDEFDGMKKLEIRDDVASKVMALPYVSDILIIIPSSTGVIISKNGWFTFNEYKKVYGFVDIEISNTSREPPMVRAADDSFCTIVLQDPRIRSDQAVICILIDKRLFEQTMQNILPENTVYACAELNGEILYKSGELNDDLVINTVSMDLPQFTITIASLSYERSLMRARTLDYIMAMVIVLLSAFCSIIVFKPLSLLIKRLGGNLYKLKDPYCFISEYVEASSERNKQLRIEKDNLSESMERFHSLMRNEIFFGILTNPRFNFYDKTTCLSIPWINDGYPYIMAIIEPNIQEKTELPNFTTLNMLSSSAIHFYAFSILHNDLCIIFWFKDFESAEKQYKHIKDQLVQLCDRTLHFSLSDIMQDPKCMAESYLTGKSEIIERKHSQFDLPISFQIELTKKIQKNTPQECIEFLYSCRATVNKNAVMEFLARVALKYDIESTPWLEQFSQYGKNNKGNSQWEVLTSFVTELCKSIHNDKHKSVVEVAEAIQNYIEENYCDSDLCMNKLSDHFSMHRTLISKIIKTQLGITFSDCLLGLRIKKSHELLQTSEMSIFEIGKAVGYEHYITFKRAFIRYNGISPLEYRNSLIQE